MNTPSPSIFESELSSFLSMMRDEMERNISLQLPLTIGQYRLERLVGHGGMGDVYEAQNIALNRKEAIKFVRSRLTLTPEMIQRFRKEIESTAMLTHPNIVTVHNAGEYEGRPYMVMEFLEGMTVHQYVRQRIELHSPLTIKEAIDILVQAARGLQFAHDKGFIHRDVKPGNLWITPNQTVKVLDLGLVLPMTLGTSDVQTVGTPDFMAPEQCLRSERREAKLVRSEEGGGRSDAKRTSDRENDKEFINSCSNILTPHSSLLTPHYFSQKSDIYSLGCTFFFLLTGRAPFDGEEYSTSAQKMEAQRTRPIPLLSQFRKDVPSRIQKILNRMTEKEPTVRYASMNDVITALNKTSKSKIIPVAIASSVALCTTLALGYNVWNSESVSVQNPIYTVTENKEQIDNKAALSPVQTVVQQQPVQDNPKIIPEDNIAPFPVGKTAGEKLVRVVDGIEYVFRWCPPGTFVMGKRILDDQTLKNLEAMSYEELLDYLDSKLMLRERDRLRADWQSIDDDNNADLERKRLELLETTKKQIIDKLTEKDKKSLRQTTLTHGFWMLDCEVSQEMWFTVMPDSPANAEIRDGDSNNVPVRKVSWNDAQAFCKVLSEKLKVDVQLPTEAQWEYACRAGKEVTESELSKQTVSVEDGLRPAPIRSKAPNAWGLYDMRGNIQEWCSDWYSGNMDLTEQTDPVGPDHSTPLKSTPIKEAKVLRGGDYRFSIHGIYKVSFTTMREYQNIDERFITSGFRVCVPVR